MNTIFKTMAAAAVLAAASVSAQAATVNGGFSMTGSFNPIGVSGSLNTATGVDFLHHDGTSNPGGNTGTFVVNGPFAGDFSGGAIVSAGTVGTIKDLLAFAGPIDNFYTVGGVEFDLLTVTKNVSASNNLSLSGTGILNVTGFDATFGAWEFTGQTVNGFAVFSWSASTGGSGGPPPAGIPEPATLSLLGMGLLGLGALRRRKG